MAVLKKIPALKELELYYLNLGETGTTHIADASSLETLSIHWLESDITDQDLARFANLKHLKKLTVSLRDGSYSSVTDQGLAHLSKLTSLEHLYLSHCPKVTDAALQHFEGLTSLKYLRLGQARITKKAESLFKAKRPDVTVIFVP